MPIINWNDNAQLLGDLATNAGRFSAQQQGYENALQDRRLGLEAERQRAELATAQARQQSLDQFHQGELSNQLTVADKRAAAQQQVTAQRDADRLDQIATQMEAQGANQDHVQQLRNEAAQKRADARNATMERGQDLTHGDRTTQNDYRYYNSDQNAETRYAGQNAANQRSSNSIQAQNQRAAGRVPTDPETVQLGIQVRKLRTEQQHWAQQYGNPSTTPEQQQWIQQRLFQIDHDLKLYEPELQRRITMPQTPTTGGGSLFNSPSPAPQNPLDIAPAAPPANADYGGEMSLGAPANGGLIDDDTMMQAHAHAKQLFDAGHDEDTVRQSLADNFGIT